MGTITIQTASGQMPAFVADNASLMQRGVIVIHEAFGVNSHIEDVAKRFGDAGYRAVAPHLFYRTGDPIIPYDDFPAALPHIQALTGGALLDDVDAIVEYLAAQGVVADGVGVVGFCMGGSVTMLEATYRRLGAAVSFYGGGMAEPRFGLPPLADTAGTLRTPWLGLFGDNDRTISVEQVEHVRTLAARAAVSTEVVRYADAGHGFFCDDRSTAYQAKAAEDAWRRTLTWLGSHLPSPDL